MRNKTAAVLAALAVLVATLSAAPAPAETTRAKKYGSCAKLRADFPRGIAKTGAAAAAQTRSGFHRPAVRSGVYKKNRRLDPDRDRTACEVRRPRPPAPVDPWLHLDARSMPPLDVMDFETGTSLDVDGFEFFEHDDSYVEERPRLSGSQQASGFGGEYFTDAPLVAGQAYDFALTVDTPAHWHCSIYDPDGCSWNEATRDELKWRFTYSAESGVIKQASRVGWRRMYR
ncbi:hypothetical protein ABFT23_01285 [Nocardioides sp. C4-1]|uniref:hypothetical protein n=1 Tax=Nocardioides sp. C4-1 TaxID=3151851 RepID=UPI003265FE3C